MVVSQFVEKPKFPMNTNPTPSAGSTIAFRKLLGIGLFTWILAMLALVGVGYWALEQSSLIGLVNWAVEHAWIAYLVGLASMIALSGRFPGALGRALVPYVLPTGVMAVLGGICFALFPDQGFLAEMLGFLFLVWLFGVFGWLWTRSMPESRENEGVLRALLPPLIGGIAVLTGVAVPAFRSNTFRYRDAFSMTLSKTVFADGKLSAEAVLEIRKPGDYSFTASRYAYGDIMEDELGSDHSTGRIEWQGAGAPRTAATGTYPLTIRWDKTSAPVAVSDNEMLDDYISLEVHTADQPDTVIHALYVPLNAK